MENKNQSTEEKTTIEKSDLKDRRNFLKKTLYSTPTIFALGQLLKPVGTMADSSVPGHPVW
jgi:hypothetical protein